MDIKIRKATISDLPNIFTVMTKYLEGAEISCFPGLSMQHAVKWACELIEHHMILLADVHGEIAGILALKEQCFLWNETANWLTSDALMVDPEYRSSKVAVELLNKAKEISDITGIPFVCGIMSGVDVELKDRFVRICGFKYVGGNFIYGGR